MVSRATLETPFSAWSSPLVACVNEEGDPISPWLASKFFEMRCSTPSEVFDLPPDELEIASDALYWDFLGTCDLKHLAMLEEKETDSEQVIARLVRRGSESLARTDAYIADLRRWLRTGDPDLAQRKAAEEQIALLEAKQGDAVRWLREKTRSIRAVIADAEAEIMDALTGYGEVEHLYTVRWTARHVRDRKEATPKTLPAFLTPDPHIGPVYISRTVEPFRRIRLRHGAPAGPGISVEATVEGPLTSISVVPSPPLSGAREDAKVRGMNGDTAKVKPTRAPKQAKRPTKNQLSAEFREKRRIWEERKKKFNGQKTEA
ncbi:hypothetical protein [Mesorhizobium sp. M2A.F.Ca.ET.043.02.1.1]|uniref:hypothetical protein n=1 Tax=Mesorhizobium sp. M2A.F.Ca.ET.043.02.1.1 TaxID=2493670 RepID=UPI000F764D67|nr:hypothetical protein [Mesorhizobium sp. M2A.F.Ca.ET.043.02.1.1]AZO05592.1 hypothetical protein EJ068_22865 [Mesorhizobium sp. M2A.F.Ca.ET.043.02.1.1]